MIRFNFPGLVMGIICGVVWGILLALNIGDTIAAYGMIGTMFLLDIAYRLRNGEDGVWDKRFDGKTGGFLGITPVWLPAVIMLALFQTGWLPL